VGTLEFERDCFFLLFIGTPRSGHSIIGAILDAHPNAIVSHELHALQKISQGWTGNQLLKGIFETSAKQAAEGRSQSQKDHGENYLQNATPTGMEYRFDYAIPTQYQGRVIGPIKVIGDKKGGGTTKILSDHPDLLTKLNTMIMCQIKIIYLVRNPYDNIATMSFRSGNSLVSQIEKYRLYIENVHEILGMVQHECLTIFQEDFIENPRKQIGLICEWLNLEPIPSFIEDASSIVYKSPHQSRSRVEWGDIESDEVEKIISKWSVLSRYKQSC
tara:strand:- start:1203 stop:2021 length:819 start_codon:yes stop_codon:yes gene_type:complete